MRAWRAGELMKNNETRVIDNRTPKLSLTEKWGEKNPATEKIGEKVTQRRKLI